MPQLIDFTSKSPHVQVGHGLVCTKVLRPKPDLSNHLLLLCSSCIHAYFAAHAGILWMVLQHKMIQHKLIALVAYLQFFTMPSYYCNLSKIGPPLKISPPPFCNEVVPNGVFLTYLSCRTCSYVKQEAVTLQEERVTNEGRHICCHKKGIEESLHAPGLVPRTASNGKLGGAWE